MTCGWNVADALGRPRDGFHAARVPVLDVALWDLVATLAGAAALSHARGGGFWAWTFGLLVAGQVLHAALGVCTRATAALGLCRSRKSFVADL